jgi:hypothetical protein
MRQAALMDLRNPRDGFDSFINVHVFQFIACAKQRDIKDKSRPKPGSS